MWYFWGKRGGQPNFLTFFSGETATKWPKKQANQTKIPILEGGYVIDHELATRFGEGSKQQTFSRSIYCQLIWFIDFWLKASYEWDLMSEKDFLAGCSSFCHIHTWKSILTERSLRCLHFSSFFKTMESISMAKSCSQDISLEITQYLCMGV